MANVLGSGFLEKVYERALLREISLRGMNAKSPCIGEYLADLLVEDRLIVELKCVDRFSNEHRAWFCRLWRNQLGEGSADSATRLRAEF